MNRRIHELVELYFDGIPYSAETETAKGDIEAALGIEYEKLTETVGDSDALEEIVSRYPKLSDMAVLAGYSAETVTGWRAYGEAQSFQTVKKTVKKRRRMIYGISFMAAASFVELIWLIYDLFVSPAQAIFVAILAFAIIAAEILLLRRLIRQEKACQGSKYDAASYEYLRKLYDRYVKRTQNSIALLFSVVSILIISELSFFFFSNSKPTELMENIFSNITLVQIPIYFCVKNFLLLKLFRGRIKTFDDYKYKKHLIGMVAFSAVYWIATVAASTVISNAFGYYFNVILICGVFFAVLMLIYNLTFRKRITFNNISINKKRIAAGVTAVVLIFGYSLIQRDTWYTQPYINSIPVVKHNEHNISYNDETGVYTIVSSTEDFKILHLTDIHLGGSLYSYSKDIKALKAVYAEIENTQPDLVIVTGDLTFPLGLMSLSLNNSAPVSQFAAFMRNADIPWAFTYGNHDTESLAILSEGELNDLYKSLSYKTSGNLLYPYVQPEISGRSNQLIEIRNADGSLNQAIFLIDSNSYTGEGINVYDYIHDDQVEWYENEIKRLQSEENHEVSSMVFFHVPLQQYRTAYELYEAGSDEVKYFFGENGEKMINKVCCSDYPSKLFDSMVTLGSTKAVFCGHDHYNNMSLEYKGIRLTYGMSIDYLAMPGIENDTDQRGAELITIHPDSTWDIRQIPLNDIT